MIAVVRSIGFLVVALCTGVAAWRYAPLDNWKPAFPGLLVALSMFGAAVLVRLARNTPFTSPGIFDVDEMKRYFDVLDRLAQRLFALLIQVLITIGIVIFSVFLSEKSTVGSSEAWEWAAPGCSGVLGFALVWLLARLLEMAWGDVGFLRLQREILESAVLRDQVKSVEIKSAAPIKLLTPGNYGRAVG